VATYSAGQIALVARAAGFSGQALVTAVAVALGESSGRTDVVNSIGCVGLWQVNQPVWVKEHSAWTVSYLQDPSHNAQAAYEISSGGSNWQPWEAYTNGAYKNYLPQAQAAAGMSPAGGAVPANWLTDIPGEVAGGVGDAVGSIIPAPITKTFDELTDPHTWLRVAYLLVGGALVIGGLLVVAKPVIEKTTAAAKSTAGAASKVAAVAA
jgi:hypothetical protein